MEKFVLPAGRYYIGDPCYVLKDDWDKVCGYLERNLIGCLGKTIFMACTAYGDGVYSDKKGNDYPVDSGCIGAVPIELIKEFGPPPCPYMIVDFPDGLEINYEGGKFEFGDIIIDTLDNEDDEDTCSECGRCCDCE